VSDLTIFALPKAFSGRFDLIQRNAIKSWTLLPTEPEIILFGDDEGTAQVASEHGVRHVPFVARNEHRTPLVDRLFADAQKLAGSSLVCYVNSDIILGPDFVAAAERLDREFPSQPFLGVGRKTNFEIGKPLEFDKAGWHDRLREESLEVGEAVTWDSDFFLFRKGLWQSIPPFAIGRCYWSSWFMYDVRRRKLPLVDMTPVVLSVESKHDYSHAKSTGNSSRLSGVEYESNRKLFKGCHYYTTVNATALLTASGLAEPPSKNGVLNITVRFQYFMYFLLKGRLYPYSLPLIVIARYGLRAKRRLGMIGRHAARAS
jgi:hypothetical protein